MKNGFVSPECIEGTGRDAGDRARADRTDVQRRLSENRGGRFNEKNMEYKENSRCGSSSMFGWSNDRSGGRAGKNGHILLQPCGGFHGIQPAGRKEEQLGLKTKAPEAFSNGYRFAYGTPVYSRGEDEQGNVVKEQQDLSLMYSKENMADLSLNIEHGNLFDESDAPDQTAVHEGITLKYSQDHYRMVPPDYEPSAEEKAQEAAGELVISYGTDRVIDQTAQTLTWEDNGQFYTLLGFDVEMTPEEFYQMAGEIIDAE